MRKKYTLSTLAVAAVLALALPVTSAFAALPVGEKAPDFELKAALAGKPTTFSLQQALKKGPVVLYFFPAAFSAGCTLEAHDFAEATDEFNQQGATVIGWGFQLQSPLVIALLILVMLASALNLFGLFEVGLSIQRVGEVGSGRSGLTGSALTVALAIIVATPCSAPFMASAVGYALTQPPLVSLATIYTHWGIVTPYCY